VEGCVRISSRWVPVKPLRCVPESVDSGAASDGPLRGVKQRVFTGDRGGWSRGFWYSQPMVNRVYGVIKMKVLELRRTPHRCDGYGSPPPRSCLFRHLRSRGDFRVNPPRQFWHWLWRGNSARQERATFHTCGLHLWRFRFAGLTMYHGSPRRLVKRCKYSKPRF
jgi:hypothetical protein